mmetsp:Transcript_16360/g.41740  ORF Transcript_16360/g.41740 Transcript_16360/m.41740 type:complete len:279 (+) Transcript_16360:2597-3433(+)
MVRVLANIVEVVVLASRTNALLRVAGASQLRERSLGISLSEKDSLELVHAGVCKQERGIVVRHHTRGWHDGVLLLFIEEVDERLPDTRAWPLRGVVRHVAGKRHVERRVGLVHRLLRGLHARPENRAHLRLAEHGAHPPRIRGVGLEKLGREDESPEGDCLREHDDIRERDVVCDKVCAPRGCEVPLESLERSLARRLGGSRVRLIVRRRAEHRVEPVFSNGVKDEREVDPRVDLRHLSGVVGRVERRRRRLAERRRGEAAHVLAYGVGFDERSERRA